MMTERERMLGRAVLEFLAADDKVADEAVIHRAIYLAFDPHPFRSEFAAILRLLDTHGMAICTDREMGRLWSITAKGKMRLAEMA